MTRLSLQGHLLAGILCAFAAVAACAQPEDSAARAPSAASREISGSVIALNWSDPIVGLSLLADDGTAWQVQTASLATLRALGIGRHALGVGTPLRVAGRVQPGSDNVLRATNILVTPNREVVLQQGARRRWIGAPP